jgi:hypothetical protein
MLRGARLWKSRGASAKALELKVNGIDRQAI